MVKPVHLQDNFGKTLIAQQMADSMHVGAEKMMQRHQKASEENVLKERERAQELDEKTGLGAVSRDAEKKNRQKGKKKNRRNKNAKEDDLEYSSDLRLRQEEDDRGKGDHLDLEG